MLKRECLRPAEIPPDPKATDPDATSAWDVANITLALCVLVFLIGFAGFMFGDEGGYKKGISEGYDNGFYWGQRVVDMPVPFWWVGSDERRWGHGQE